MIYLEGKKTPKNNKPERKCLRLKISNTDSCWPNFGSMKSKLYTNSVAEQ